MGTKTPVASVARPKARHRRSPSARRARPSAGARHLFLALHARSWGRVEMALRAAEELRAKGAECHLILHESCARLTAGASERVEAIPAHMAPLLPLLIWRRVRSWRPDLITHFDFLNNANALVEAGLGDPGRLLDLDAPTVTLDTWDESRTGTTIDRFGRSGSLVLDRSPGTLRAFEELPHRLVPVPVGRIDDRERGVRCLPTNQRRATPRVESEPRITLCTAPWQHREIADPDGMRLAENVPDLVARTLRALTRTVELVHVGPAPFPAMVQVLGKRYRWLPPMSRDDMGELLAATDLLLSLNMAATTMARAMVARVPVALLHNSCAVRDLADAGPLLGSAAEPWFEDWIARSLPVYPFSLWPLGYHRFLRPLAQAPGGFESAITALELLRPQEVTRRIGDLLFDPAARGAALERQDDYVRQLGRLPSLAERLQSLAS